MLPFRRTHRRRTGLHLLKDRYRMGLSVLLEGKLFFMEARDVDTGLIVNDRRD
jgi:hypothetical protein